MRRHVVIEMDVQDGWDADSIIELVQAALTGLPVVVIRPSHGRTQMNPRVEFVGWTPEDLKRAGA